MKAKKVYETLGFQRGQSSKKALNIGLRAKISSWLDEMQVRNYTINDDLTIDVDGHVNLSSKLNGNLPSFIKFGNITRGFDCGYNNLTSLEGLPSFIRGHCYCSNNNLTSLEGAPQSVGGYFYCEHNNLTSLEGAPQSVDESFSCSNNNLTSLEEAPSYVGGGFFCYDNKVQFTKEDVKKVSNVGGNIYV